MKTLWTIVSVMAFLHLAGFVGFISWMVASDHLDTNRAQAIRTMLTQTVAEEAQAKIDQAELASTQVADTKGVGKILPKSASQRIDEDQRQQEKMLRHLERTRQEVKQLQRNLELAQIKIQKERNAYIANKKAFEEKLTKIEKNKNDEGFKKNVEIYSGLPPKDVKRVFVQMIEENKQDTVVEFLEAMDTRKVVAVLKEFKEQKETKYIVELTQLLRERGSTLVSSLENAS